MAPIDIDWGLQAAQLDFDFALESVELERGGTGRRFDRLRFDAVSDAHAVGCAVTNGLSAEAIAMPSKFHTPAMDGRGKAVGSVQMEYSRVVTSVEWRRVVDGVEWRRVKGCRGMASMASMASMVASNGT